MRTNAAIALTLFALSLLTGCSVAKTSTFEVHVHNGTSEPITIGLAKVGGSFEDLWATPEEAAMRSSRDERPWGVLVPPGKIGSAGPVKGTFGRNDRGYLRVYAGEVTMSEILATSRESPLRIDVPLSPGRNDIAIQMQDGKLVAAPGIAEPTR